MGCANGIYNHPFASPLAPKSAKRTKTKRLLKVEKQFFVIPIYLQFSHFYYKYLGFFFLFGSDLPHFSCELSVCPWATNTQGKKRIKSKGYFIMSACG